MTTKTTSAADRIVADVRQLADPIYAAVRGQLITHDPLLLQLRDACVPGRGVRSEARRPPPGPRPGAREDPLEALLWIYEGLMLWRCQLGLPHPPQSDDWQLSLMRALSAAAPSLPPAVLHMLSADVANWWHEAAVWAGWKPADLLKLR